MPAVAELPSGWCLSELGVVADVIRGITFPASAKVPQPEPHTVLCLRTSNVQATLTWEDVLNVPRDYVKSENRWLRVGDIMISMANSLELVGKVAYADSVPGEVTFGGFISAIRTRGVDSKFLFHLLRSQATQDAMRSTASRTVNIANLSLRGISPVQIPVAPLPEQKRIVAKIDALQQHSAAAKESLDAIPPLLEKFRQSVLAAAFRGDLTREWREGNPPPPKDWRAAAADSAGDQVTARSGPRLWGSGTTASEVQAEWGTIPADWEWVRLKELSLDPGITVQIGPMSMKSNEFVTEGVPVFNVGCVQWGRLDPSKANYLPALRAQDFERYRVRPDDVLFTRSGTVGRSAVVPEGTDALMTFHLLRVRTTPSIYLPRLLYYAFLGCRAVLEQVGASAMGATRKGFNTRLLEGLWIPVPPPGEQRKLVFLLDELMEDWRSLGTRCEAGLHALATLDQSILAKGFRGELVQQDPADEPASALLDRIRAECAASEPTKKKRKSRARRG